MHRHGYSKTGSAQEDPSQPMSALLSAVGEERAAFTGVLDEVAATVCRAQPSSCSDLSALASPEVTPGRSFGLIHPGPQPIGQNKFRR